MRLDARAIEGLYRSHGHIVLRRARMLLGSEADAQEALQEVFASLLHEPQAVKSFPSITGWLYRAATHQCLNQLRNRRTGAKILTLHFAPAKPGLASANAEALAEVRSLLAQLPDDVAQAVVCTHLDGMTHDETALQLGCSKRQVGYLLERARESLAREEKRA